MANITPSESLLTLLEQEIKSVDDIRENLASEYDVTTYEKFERHFIDLRNKFKNKLLDISDPDQAYLMRSEARKASLDQIIQKATSVAESFQEARENKRLNRPKSVDAIEDLSYALKNLMHLIEETKQNSGDSPPLDVPIGTPKNKKRRSPKKQPLPSPNQIEESFGFKEIEKDPRTDSDRPYGQDKLNYTKYAQSFAKIILNHETSTPLTIGIYGQWGQGKSFLMGKIKEELNKSLNKKAPFSFSAFWKKYNPKSARESLNTWRKTRNEIVDYHVVEFNAWAYVGTDHLWAGLVTHLYKEIESYFGFRVTLARLRQAFGKMLPKSIPIVVLYVVLGFGVSLLFNFKETQQGWEGITFALKAFAGTLLGGTALAGLPVLLTTLKEFVDNFALSHSKNLQNLAAKPDFKAQVGIMGDIKDEIRFMGKLLRKGKQGRSTRFILFIDDLDRCEHKKAVEVMQAIMLLLTDEDGAPFVIFMGIDARVIVHAIEETYGNVLVNAGINGYEYLDKIVQIPFVIPPAPLEIIKQYVDSMLWTDEEKSLVLKKKAESKQADETKTQPPIVGNLDVTLDNVATTSLDEISVSFTEEERQVINQCTEVMVSNPRKIKRIVNIYRYARLILPIALEQNRAKVVRWFVMTEQWPLHLAWILQYIENDRQTTKKLAKKKMSDVYKLAKKNIHSEEMESLLTIDADPDTFVKFMNENNFSVQDILTLLPITFNLNPAIRSKVGKQMLKISETELGLI